MITKIGIKSEILNSNRVRAALNETGISQHQLAVRVRCSRHHIHDIISGKKKNITVGLALRIASVLGRSVESLFILNEF